MAYGTLNRINGNKNQENLDRHLKLDDKLDSHQKPVKIGDDITGLQLAGKDVKIEGNLTIDGDISVSGEIDGGSNANNLKGNTTIGYPEGDTVAIVGSNIYIGEPQNYGSATGSVAKIGARTSNDTSTDLVLNSREDYVDNLTISVGTSGLSTISTNDGGGAAAHLEIDTDGNLTIDSGGDIILDSADGNFIAKKASVEFSAANSSYAGMILGYTRIQNNGTTSGQANISVNTGSMTVLQTVQGTDLSVTFKSPPSGNVEIECSFWTTATSKGVKFSLSDNASYNEVDETHTYDADQTIYIDESDHAMHTVRFAVSGLTAGTSYTYFLAGLASGTFYISHGRNRTAGTFYPPIILKAIALPNTITTGE